MINCYNLIGKQILSLVSGEIVGIVKNIEIKNMRLSRILAFNDESDLEEDFLFDAKNVFSFGEDVITLKKEDFEIVPEYKDIKIVGANLFNQEGVKLDSIINILVDDSLRVIEFIGEQKAYSPSEIFSIKNDVILLKGTAKIIKTKNINKLKVSENKIVKTLNNKTQTLTLANDIVVNKNAVLDNNTPVDTIVSAPSSPKRTLANFSFLINRVITKTLYATNGKTIINVGSIVNEQTVLNAFENNLLKDLIEFSKPQ